MNGAEILVEMLKSYGVKHIFGVPGDTSMDLYDAFYHARDDIRHIMARDERSASFMADAYARISGKIGVCEGPSGGGATYLIPGVAEAQGSSVPLLALTTDLPLSVMGKGHLTAIDQELLFKAATKWNTTIKHAGLIPDTVHQAMRHAYGGKPGAVHLVLPADVLAAEAEPEERAFRPMLPPLNPVANPLLLEETLDWLQRAQSPVIVAGGGVMLSRGWNALTQLAEMLAIPVATTLNGKGSIDEMHPLSLGVIGGNGARDYANTVLEECDLVFYIGSKVNNVATADDTVPPKDAGVHTIQLDLDPYILSANRYADLEMVGDARASLEALVEMAKQRGVSSDEMYTFRRAWLGRIQELANNWWKTAREAMADNGTPGEPIKPQRLMGALMKTLPGNSILVCDPGTPTPFVGAYYRVPEGRHTVIPRAHGGLGFAIPAVVGAKIARPDVPVVGLCGDGSFGMAAGELETIHRLGEPVIVIQCNNGTFGWIKMLQHLHHGKRYYGVDFSTDTDAVMIARGFGLHAERIERAEDLEPALQDALKRAEPTFLDVATLPPMDEVAPVAAWQRALRPAES